MLLPPLPRLLLLLRCGSERAASGVVMALETATEGGKRTTGH